MKNAPLNYTFKQGIKDGLPIGLGYLSVSFAFGVQASLLGVPVLISLFTSMTNMTSAGQLAGITVLTSAGTFVSLILSMILTQLVINARYFLMAISLSQKMDDSFTLKYRFLFSFAITDEIFAVGIGKKKPIGTHYFCGLSFLPYVCWAGGTLLGALAGSILPIEITQSLGIALYAMFIAIIIPPSTKSLGVFLAVVLGAGISCLFYFAPVLNQVEQGIAITVSALLSAIIMALIFPIKEKNSDENPNTSPSETENLPQGDANDE